MGSCPVRPDGFSTTVSQVTIPGLRRIRAGPGEIEFRYDDDGKRFTLKAFSESVETVSHGLVTELPQWMKDIITLAKVGNHCWAAWEIPPRIVIWFVTDLKYNLVSFISPNEPKGN
jgi:hypothetical protein